MLSPLDAFESALLAQRVFARAAGAKVFPVGAIVLVDGRDKARVTQVFPEGSTSLMAPHYVVDFIGGDRSVKVNMKRVGVRSVPGGKIASVLRLGPGQLETRNSDVLKRMTKFRSRPKGDLAGAVEAAAGLAKKTGKDMYVWNGRSFMHSVWNVSATEAKALGPFENIGQYVYRVTPELDCFKHEVLGRPEPMGSSEE